MDNTWVPVGRTRRPYIRAAHAVSRTCDNEVGVVISIRDPYTSPFTSP